MHPIARRILPIALLALAPACAAHVQTPQTVRAAAERQVAEAQAFMASYAEDLLAGRRDAIIARYDTRGAWMMGGGAKRMMPVDSIAALYRGNGWQPPKTFAWRDLSYEVAGPDAVVITGLFDWGTDSGMRVPISYTSLLVRRDGRWMIRVEHESGPANR